MILCYFFIENSPRKRIGMLHEPGFHLNAKTTFLKEKRKKMQTVEQREITNRKQNESSS